MPPVDIDAAVISNTRLSDDYNVVALDAAEIARNAQPGQFVMVKPAHGTDPLLRRPFSIFEILPGPDGEPLGFSLLNKRVGPGTEALFRLTPGERITCLGPLGRPFTPVDPPAAAWMVAGGVGLAPFATLAPQLRRRGTPTTLFYGARRARDLYYLELFDEIGVRLVLTTEDGSRGERGRITEPLVRELQDIAPGAPVFYACGPTRMLRAVAMIAAARGCRCQVALEQVMGCGLGGCYSCVVRVRDDEGVPHFVRSCLSGPVLDGERIVWEEM